MDGLILVDLQDNPYEIVESTSLGVLAEQLRGCLCLPSQIHGLFSALQILPINDSWLVSLITFVVSWW